MKRRVIQIGNSTQMVSLPRKWAQRQGIKKGDELDIEEQGPSLRITRDGMNMSRTVQIDISHLDNSSILHKIQAAYRSGYDEIHIKFDNDTTIDYKTGKTVKPMEAVAHTVGRLIGAEVISQSSHSCLIRDISQTAPEEFDNVARRIFLLTTDMAKDIQAAAKSFDLEVLKSIKGRHDTVTKFVSFCLRLLSKKGDTDERKTSMLFHIFSTMDCVADVLKYTAVDLMEHGKQVTDKAQWFIDSTNTSLTLFSELYYTHKSETLNKLSKNRRAVRKEIRNSLASLEPKELIVVTHYVSMLDTLLDLTEWCTALEIIE